MGAVISRFYLDGLRPNRRRSHHDEPLYSYSLNKNYFSNYFLMGGERFEVDNPDYLFGDSCDLNFLSCTKPYSLPYKKAQQDLLDILNSKQKTNNKVSSCVNVNLAPSLNLFTSRNRQVSQCSKQDAQTQTLSKGIRIGKQSSQPLIMLINIRKETLRLVKSSNISNADSDSNNLSNTQSQVQNFSLKTVTIGDEVDGQNISHHQQHGSTSKNPNQKSKVQASSLSTNRLSTNSSQATTTATIHLEENNDACVQKETNSSQHDTDTTSSISSPRASLGATASDAEDSLSRAESLTSSKSAGYTSVRDVPLSIASDDDENFEDALNDTTNLSISKDEVDDDDSERIQQQESLLRDKGKYTKENRDIRILVKNNDDDSLSENESSVRICRSSRRKNGGVMYIKRSSSRRGAKKNGTESNDRSKKITDNHHLSNRVYNIEFQFDTEVECSIRIFYFCRREVTNSSVTYRPQHATYKSKTYIYKRGLNQKFEQIEHTFQPYLFDEDLLIYKPLDLEGNYNSGAVFPIVIHCVALDGPQPRQSQSLIATVEKSQLDDSYSIKPVKQLIFVDGVQYILQDIYGIENKNFVRSSVTQAKATTPIRPTTKQAAKASTKNLGRLTTNSSLRSSMVSVCSNNMQNLSDTASIASGLIIDGGILNGSDLDDDHENDVLDNGGETRGSSVSVTMASGQQFKSLNSDAASFECVICMSEERDTMLLPCRHLCLCSSCAQSLRYQANSCPICRCPFKAALNLRVVQPNNAKRRRYRRRREQPDDQQPRSRQSRYNQSDSGLKQQKSGSWSTMATVGSTNRRSAGLVVGDQSCDPEEQTTTGNFVEEKMHNDIDNNNKSSSHHHNYCDQQRLTDPPTRRGSETCAATPLLAQSHHDSNTVLDEMAIAATIEADDDGARTNIGETQPISLAGGESDCALLKSTTTTTSTQISQSKPTTSTTTSSSSSSSLAQR